MKPYFSIITCTSNSAKFIKSNIESVSGQNFRNFEHIFIDSYSSDDTLGIIESYRMSRPDKVRFFQTEKKGIANAMNFGLQKAKGDYLIYLHSDDYFESGSILKEINDFLKISDLDWIYGQIKVIDVDDKVIGVFPIKQIFQTNSNNILKKYLLKFYNFIPHQAVFMKKSALEKYGGFDETLRSAMDVDLWLKIRNETNWAFIPKVISNYRLHAHSQSSGRVNLENNQKDIFVVKKRYLNVVEFWVFKIVDKVIGRKNYR